MNLADLRQDYRLQSLDIADVAADPMEQFKKWFEEALKSELLEPNAMTLATVSEEGKPSARIVLLKEINPTGFVFFTNYNSRKGEQIDANPYAALCFCWLELQRQIRIEGTIEKIDAAASDAYFHSRPIGSQIGAWASPQSDVIKSRTVLEEREAFYKKQFDTEGVLQRPAHWGGYILKPTLIEFWQGRSSRLHDRIMYILDEGEWITGRLAP